MLRDRSPSRDRGGCFLGAGPGRALTTSPTRSSAFAKFGRMRNENSSSCSSSGTGQYPIVQSASPWYCKSISRRTRPANPPNTRFAADQLLPNPAACARRRIVVTRPGIAYCARSISMIDGAMPRSMKVRSTASYCATVARSGVGRIRSIWCRIVLGNPRRPNLPAASTGHIAGGGGDATSRCTTRRDRPLVTVGYAFVTHLRSTVCYSAGLSGTVRGQPAFERRLALERAASGDERVHTDVFVEGRPMNALTVADQAPGGPLLGSRAEEVMPRSE